MNSQLLWALYIQLHNYTENWVWSVQCMLVLQCYYCSAYHFTQVWRTFYYHRADPELQGLMVCSLQHDKIFNAPSNSHAQYPVLDVQYKVQVFTQTAITTHA